MYFVTYAEMRRDAALFAARFHGKVDAIVGIPRSGTLVANLMALHLNVPCGTDQNLRDGTLWPSGPRYRTTLPIRPRVLYVDDSALSGNSMKGAMAFGKVFPAYQTVGLAVLYASRSVAEQKLIEYHRVVDSPRLFAWNFAHANFTKHVMFDFDGVLCEDPKVKEEDEAGYVEDVKTTKPLLLPSWPMRAIVTHRLEKRRQISINWLKKHGVMPPPKMFMFQAKDYLERRQHRLHGGPAQNGAWKGQMFKDDPDALLFVESDGKQARRIAQVSGKPCYCPALDEVYR